MVIGDGPFLDRYIFQKKAVFFSKSILTKIYLNNEINITLPKMIVVRPTIIIGFIPCLA